VTADPRHALGRDAEDRALEWLESQGLSLLTRNWRGNRGELDLVMWHGDILVIVEVRARPGRPHAAARASVDAGKARRLKAATREFLGRSGIGDTAPVRIDIVTVAGTRANPDLRWWRHAL
jgi:putative endonuclease